jgi:hypothetical protein
VCATDPYLNVTCSSAVLIELPLFDVTCMHLQVIAANFGALLRL